nr:Gag-Pol polyprotein [Tanacetum cinerariifolium]
MKVLLKKDKFSAAIGKMPANITDGSKWDEMDINVIVNLYLALADGVSSSIEEKKSTKKIQNILLVPHERAEIILQSLLDSYDQLIINLTNNVLSDYPVFDDVVAAIQEEKIGTTIGRTNKLVQDKWRLADDERKIIQIGSIMVKMHDVTVYTIHDVPHMEGLKKNLLSLGQLDDLGCKMKIHNKIMKIIKGALVKDM